MRLPQDIPRARRVLSRGCELGNLAACRTSVSIDYDDGNNAEACHAWEGLCQRGDARSCAFTAMCLLYDEKAQHDPQRGVALLKDNCARGERVACRELAAVYLNGKFEPRDEKKSYGLVERACQADDPLACNYLAMSLEKGSGVAVDLARAKSLYRMACARGIRSDPCGALRRLGETPPTTVVTTGGVGESLHVSKQLAYEWRLPANWEFIAPEEAGAKYPAMIEVVAARRRGGAAQDTLALAGTDFVTIVPGKPPDAGMAIDAWEELVSEALSREGATKTGRARIDFLGHPALRLDWRVDAAPRPYLALVIMGLGGRIFEIRCASATYQTGLPCADGYGALAFAAAPNSAGDALAPRATHLQEDRYHLSYDPPGPGWLAVGPRLGMMGHLSVWIWNKEGRQIDVAVMDLRGMPQRLEQQSYTQGLADQFRKDGKKVTLSGIDGPGGRWTHLVIDPASALPPAERQDMFVLLRDDLVYSVLVTEPAHDPAFVRKALGGVRLNPRQ